MSATLFDRFYSWTDCGSAAPANGIAVTTNGTTLGATASILCNEGYNLNGTSSVTCTESGWDTLPICEIQGKRSSFITDLHHMTNSKLSVDMNNRKTSCEENLHNF